MNVWEIIVAIVLIIASLAIILIVLLQQGRQANIGAINGAMDSFMEKGKAKTWDARLSKWTKVISIAFFVLVLAGMLITNFLGSTAG
ncbi:MAG: preprotein translocase subunit SecG [Acutalibacteraceae bacterium]